MTIRVILNPTLDTIFSFCSFERKRGADKILLMLRLREQESQVEALN